MERYIVTASLCWSQPHSQTPRDTSLSLGVCEWGCDQHQLAVTVLLSIAPSLHPSLPSFPPFSPVLPPSLPPSPPSLPPSILLLSSSGWPGLPPLVFVPIVSFYNTSNVFSSATPSVGGRGRYPVAAPAPSEESGEVPSGRPRTFCGGQWREGGLQGGSNGKGEL